jgi:hypothetical protein
MAKSINQIQNEIAANEALLNELSKLEEIGTNNLPATERTIIEYAVEFIKKVQENLKELNKIDTGSLVKDVAKGELINQSGVYSIEIGYPVSSKSAKYYDFVNKGVQGFISKSPNSPYKFRNAMPSSNGPMVLALQKWMKRNGMLSRKETASTTKSGLQRKRKAISELDSSRQGAWLLARKIKSRGLPKTGYFDDAIDEYFGDTFGAAMAKAVGADIRVGVKQVNSLINDKNK